MTSELREATVHDLEQVRTWLKQEDGVDGDRSFFCNIDIIEEGQRNGSLTVLLDGTLPVAFALGSDNLSIVAVKRDRQKGGVGNPEIRRNFYLEDTVEAGNFVSRERLVSCGRRADEKVSMERLYFGGDWARKSDNTWFAVANDHNDIIDWLKVPHAQYEEQCVLVKDWLTLDRGG